MNFKQLETDPQNYYWYKEGFNKEELEKVYKGVENLPFVEATVIGNQYPLTIKSIRSSSVKWIPKNDEWMWLYDKLMDMATTANKEIWNFNLISAPELIQYTEYYDVEGGHYNWHQDIGAGGASHRKVSITVQLSEPDEYEGGNLEMWKGGESYSVAERGAGVVFIFPSYMMHRVTKVTKGTRRSFVLWVGGDHYR
jgi:PKHD-type hydroxylase